MHAATVAGITLPELVEIPGGSFVMGDALGAGFPQERPAHQVTVESFRLGRYCVTAAEYAEFARAEDAGFDELWCDFVNPCFIVKSARGYVLREGAERYPMVQVSFVGAVAYANWLSRRCGLEAVYDLDTLEADPARDGFRLPTEAEWERACDGSSRGDPSTFARVRAGAARVGGFGPWDGGPLPVGTLPPNGFGVHEMLGNVNQWCHDRYAPYPVEPQFAPSGAESGSFRVLRGGSFLDDARHARPTYRHGIHYRAKCSVDGFRLARRA